jgi:hypothetical protein
VQEIDLFDFITGQMQELALADRDDLQVGLKQRKIPRPQRGQETIASMLVLIWIHVGPTSTVCPTFHAGSFALPPANEAIVAGRVPSIPQPGRSWARPLGPRLKLDPQRR